MFSYHGKDNLSWLYPLSVLWLTKNPSDSIMHLIFHKILRVLGSKKKKKECNKNDIKLLCLAPPIFNTLVNSDRGPFLNIMIMRHCGPWGLRNYSAARVLFSSYTSVTMLNLAWLALLSWDQKISVISSDSHLPFSCLSYGVLGRMSRCLPGSLPLALNFRSVLPREQCDQFPRFES